MGFLSNILAKLKPGEYTSPLEIPYIKYIKFTLSLIGGWPFEVGQEPWYYKFRSPKSVFCIFIPITTFCARYMIKNLGVSDFVELGKSYISSLMAIVTMQRLYSTWTKDFKDTTKNFINSMHLLHYRCEHEYAKQVYENVHKFSTIFTYLMLGELYIGLILFNLTPVYNSYHRGMYKQDPPANATYDSAVDYDIPLNYKTDFRGYIFLFIINWFVSYDVCICFAGIDSYLAVIVFNIWGHIKILKYNLRTFPRPKMRGVRCGPLNPPWYDEDESKEIKALLLDNMKRHRLIKTFMDDVSQSFGLTICVYYAFQQIADCIILLELAELTVQAFTIYGVMGLNYLQQLIQMSFIFELVATQSETIKDAVYDVPWECMDNKNRKIVLIYLCNVQKPMELKAMGVVPVGVRTMATIMKNTISYFMFLRASVSR